MQEVVAEVEEVQPTPTPTVTPAAQLARVPVGWDTLLQKHFGQEWQNAKRVMECESSSRPWIVNNNPRTGDYSVGLFQINLIGSLAKSRPSEQWLKNPENNIAYAADMQQRQGWSPWTCARKLGII